MLSAVPVLGSSTKARIRSGSGSQRLGALSPDAVRLFPPRRASGATRGLGDLSPGAAGLFPLRPQRVQVGCQQLEFVLRRWPLAETLPAVDVDHPESQEFFR